jgi:5-methylcytosine-specific restriction endonuclease McrA
MDLGSILGLIIVVAIIVGVFVLRNRMFEIRRKQRREYYREYLQSEEWKRKRYVVLKRDNWRCVYCGAPATEVHHLKYAKYNIGKEPIDWLVSVCKNCHKSEHFKY